MTTKNTQKLLSTIIAITSVMFVAQSMSTFAFADHPLTTGNKQSGGNVDICYL